MTPKVKGSHPFLVLLCLPQGLDAPAWPTISYFRQLMSGWEMGGLFDYWTIISGGHLNIGDSKVIGWIPLRKTLTDIEGARRAELGDWALNAAKVERHDVSGYRHYIVLIYGNMTQFGSEGSFFVSGIYPTRGQSGWYWCEKCDLLAYWDYTRGPGKCPSGGVHNHSRANNLAVIQNQSTGTEGGWRWCSRCEGLVHDADPPGACSEGGFHDTSQSSSYFVRRGTELVGEQPNWRHCRKCHCLVSVNAAHVSSDPEHDDSPRICAAGKQHDFSASGLYNLPFGWEAELGGFAHESGHVLGFNHAFGPQLIGSDDDTRPGAYGDPTDIMSWANTFNFYLPVYRIAGPAMSGATLHKMGWLADDQIQQIISPKTKQQFLLSPLYKTGPHPKMLQVVLPDRNQIYTITHRTATGWDKGFPGDLVVVQLQRTLYAAGQDSWQHCVECHGMVHPGSANCPAGGSHDGSESGEYFIQQDLIMTGGQANWRWCSKCQGLVFAGESSVGPCPGGGQHQLSFNSNYVLYGDGGGQGNWRFCHKCNQLAYDGHKMKGTCAGGGQHDFGWSSEYVLPRFAGEHRQEGWRWCKKCNALYFASHGRCLGNHGVHKLTGDDFSLAHNLPGVSGQAHWKWCRKCSNLGFFDGTRSPGKCAAGGVHDYRGSGSYVLPLDTEAECSQPRWFVCSTCLGMHYVEPQGKTGTCTNGARHTEFNRPDQYQVPHNTNNFLGDVNFRYCKNCFCLVHGINPPGCTGGRSHDTSASGRYTIRFKPALRNDERAGFSYCSKCNILIGPGDLQNSPCNGHGQHMRVGNYFISLRHHQPKWRWCKNCELLVEGDGESDPVACPAGGLHNHVGSSFYLPPRLHDDVVQLVHKDLRKEFYYTEGGGLKFEVLPSVRFGASGIIIQISPRT